MFSNALRRGVARGRRAAGALSNVRDVLSRVEVAQHFSTFSLLSTASLRGGHRLSSLSTTSELSKRAFSSAGQPVDNLNDPNTYTENTFSVLSKMPQYAEMYSLQYMEAPLLLHSSLNEGKQSLAYRVLKTAEADPGLIMKKVDEHLKTQPKVQTNNRVMGQSTIEALRDASKLKSEYGDQFISTEHILLALSKDRPADQLS